MNTLGRNIFTRKYLLEKIIFRKYEALTTGAKLSSNDFDAILNVISTGRCNSDASFQRVTDSAVAPCMVELKSICDMMKSTSSLQHSLSHTKEENLLLECVKAYSTLCRTFLLSVAKRVKGYSISDENLDEQCAPLDSSMILSEDQFFQLSQRILEQFPIFCLDERLLHDLLNVAVQLENLVFLRTLCNNHLFSQPTMPALPDALVRRMLRLADSKGDFALVDILVSELVAAGHQFTQLTLNTYLSATLNSLEQGGKREILAACKDQFRRVIPEHTERTLKLLEPLQHDRLNEPSSFAISLEPLCKALKIFCTCRVALDSSSLSMIVGFFIGKKKFDILVDLIPILLTKVKQENINEVFEAQLIEYLFFSLTSEQSLLKLALAFLNLFKQHNLALSIKAKELLLEAAIDAHDIHHSFLFFKECFSGESNNHPLSAQIYERLISLCVKAGLYNSELFIVLKELKNTGYKISAEMFEKIFYSIHSFGGTDFPSNWDGSERLVAWTSSLLHTEILAGSDLDELRLSVLQLSKSVLLPPAFLDLVHSCRV